jgi:integrase
MPLHMPGPWKHPTTGVYYLRERIPAGLRERAVGRVIPFCIAGQWHRVTAGSGHVKVSLRTRDNSEAKARYKEASAGLVASLEMLSKGPRRLTHKQAVALAGEAYREWMARFEEDPGASERWVREEADNLRAEFGRYGAASLRIASRDELRAGSMEARFGSIADATLAKRRLLIDDESRARLLKELLSASRQAAITLMKRAEGDYSTDLNASRFPEWEDGTASAHDVSLSSLFESWARERQPARSTLDQWRKHVGEFGAFVGHDDVMRLTKRDVASWKDALVSRGDSPKTIRDSKLAALKTVLQWGCDNDLVAANPAARVTVKGKARAGAGMLGFSDEEAATILAAAAREDSPAYRWIPLLCAASGARVSEVAQLRGKDIGRMGEIVFMNFTAEAGSLKNEASERSVPLHPSVIAAGFLDFVRSKGSGPLFYDPAKRKADSKKPPAKIVGKNVAAWVHKLGIEIGRRHRKDPNHAWRHRFHTKARTGQIVDSMADKITGRVPRGSGGGYGEGELQAMLEALSRIPIPAHSRKDA